MIRKFITFIIMITFLASSVAPIPAARAQGVYTPLPPAGVMVTPTPAHTPALIKGVTIHPENPLKLDFIVHTGDDVLEGEALKKESDTLIKYFLTSLTVPEDQMWVNLSPHESDRIMADGLRQTDMGRDLLAQDYLLKQLTASLMYPENDLGQAFWDRIHKKAYEKYGTTDVPTDVFNKVWIVPERAVVHVKGQSAFVLEHHLKVMLEQDYVALQHNRSPEQVSVSERVEGEDVTREIIREVIIPEIEREVNTGKNFAKLRQIFNSVILATWYKKNLRQSILTQVYADQNKMKGVDVKDQGEIEQLYSDYVAAFKQGAYDYIKEDYDAATQEVVARKYFSGGVVGAVEIESRDDAMIAQKLGDLQQLRILPTSFEPQGIKKGLLESDSAMVSTMTDTTRHIDEFSDNENDGGENKKEIRQLPEVDEIENVETNLYVYQDMMMDSENALTPRVRDPQKDNQFISYVIEQSEKTKEEILAELDSEVHKMHYRLHQTHGFISRADNTQAETIHRIFDRLIEGYNEQADLAGRPYYEGKLFIIDSPEVNAFVFIEHSDVYIHAGMIRELAHFAQLTGIEFNEDLIAAILAHELTHIIQHSSYMGLPVDEVARRRYLPQEVVEMRRKAEYHADEGAISILSYAGFSPRSMLIVLDFLSRISQNSTAAESLAGHPHAKERVVNLEIYMEDERKVFPGWTSFTSPLDAEEFKNFKSRHVGFEVSGIHSLDDIKNLLAQAQTIEEVLELVRIAKYVEHRTYALKRIGVKRAKEALAREIYISNVIDFMVDIITHLGEKPYWARPSIPLASQEGLLLQRLTRDQSYESVPDIDEEISLSDIFENEKELDQEAYLRMLTERTRIIMKHVRGLHIDSGEKIRLLALFERIYQMAREDLLDENVVNSGLFDVFTASSPEDQTSYEKLVQQAASGESEARRGLRTYPSSIYKVYGQDALDKVGINLWGEYYTRDVYFERSSFFAYEKDIRLVDAQTQHERQRLFEAIMIPYIFLKAKLRPNQPLEGFHSPGMQEAVNKAVIRLAPGADHKLKQWFALYVSGYREGYPVKAVQQYVQSTIPMEAGIVFSGLFDREYGANRLIGPFKALDQDIDEEIINFQEAGWLELNYSAKSVAGLILDMAEGNDADRIIRFVRKVFSGFSAPFRKSVIEELTDYRGADLLTLFQWKRLLRGLIHPEDESSVLLNIFKRQNSYENRYKVFKAEILGLDHQGIKDYLVLFETIIDHSRSFTEGLGDQFLRIYVILRLRDFEKRAREELGISEDQDIDRETESKVMERASHYLSAEEAFQILHRLSQAGFLNYSSELNLDIGDQDDFLSGKVSRETVDQLTKDEQSRKWGMKLAPENTPLAFFRELSHRLDPVFVRRLFDLSLEQLGALSQNQYRLRVRESNRVFNGLESIFQRRELPDSTNAQRLIDQLIFMKNIRRSGVNIRNLDGENILTEALLLGPPRLGIKDTGGGKKGILIYSGVRYFKISPHAFGRGFDLNEENSENVQRAREFFEGLAESGFMGHYRESDRFFQDIAKTPVGLRAFPFYAPLMTDMEFPVLREQSSDYHSRQSSYLSNILQSVILSGEKAEAFQRYDRDVLHLSESNMALEEKLRWLALFLPDPNLLKDGFIDQWERDLLPELDLDWLEQKGLEYLSEKDSGLRGEYSEKPEASYPEFRAVVIANILQWQKVKNLSATLSKRSAKDVLSFYRLTIPLIFDPQRQLRMGVAAMKIFNAVYPEASFEEEFMAIKEFFPFASDARDQQLYALLDNHIIPHLEEKVTQESLDEVVFLLKDNQDFQYEEKLTNANFVENTIKSILSGASRQGRADLLFWILDPDGYPKPDVIKQLEDKRRVSFDELPVHVSFMPEEYRVRILQGLFLGENGLFVPRSSADEIIMDDFVDSLFLYFFPQRKSRKGILGSNGQEVLDDQTYEMVRSVFPVVMREYSPARRTSIALSLLKLHDQIHELSEGKRLARLLAALGPVGFKIGQYLSENKNLIPSDALRSDLADLKENAAPVSKLAILDRLRQEGFDLDAVRVGKRLASASMKQVHEGWMRNQDGQWVEVVIKVLRPKVDRTVSEDIRVFKAVTYHLKEKRGMDTSDLVEIVENWIKAESDFRIEAKNTQMIQESIDAYYDRYPQRKDRDRAIRVPEVFVGNKATLMIEERVRGLEVARLLTIPEDQQFIDQEAEFQRDIHARLSQRGLSEEEIGQVLSLDRQELIDRLRKMLLFQIFDSGTFHADVHGANVMAAPEQEYLIDMGLVKSLNERQRQGAGRIISGVLTHDADILFSGIEDMHIFSSDVSDAQREDLKQQFSDRKPRIIKEIKDIFRKRANIKTEINDVSSLILNEGFGLAGDGFSAFMKAFTQAIWLFPTDIFHALDTLRSLSDQLDLSNEDYRKAIRTHAWPVLKNALAIYVINAKERFSSRLSQRFAPLAHWWHERKRAFKHVGLAEFFAQGMDVAVWKIEQRLKDEWIPDFRRKTKYNYLIGWIRQRKNRYRSYKRPELPEINIKDPGAGLTLIPSYAALSAKEQEQVIESFKLYGKIFHMLYWGRSHTLDAGDGIDIDASRKELFLLKALGEKELQTREGMHLSDLIARTLTTRILKARYQKTGPTQRRHIDYLSPRNPILRALGETWADMYIKDLEERDRLEDSPVIKEKSLWAQLLHIDQYWEQIQSAIEYEEEKKSVLVSGEHTGEDRQVFYERKEGSMTIPHRFKSYKIRGAIDWRRLKSDETKTSKTGRFGIVVKRTGFAEKSRYEIDLIDFKRLDAVHLSLDQKGLNRFLRGGSVEAVYYESWKSKRVPPDEFVFRSMDTALGEQVDKASVDDAAMGADLRNVLNKDFRAILTDMDDTIIDGSGEGDEPVLVDVPMYETLPDAVRVHFGEDGWVDLPEGVFQSAVLGPAGALEALRTIPDSAMLTLPDSKVLAISPQLDAKQLGIIQHPENHTVERVLGAIEHVQDFITQRIDISVLEQNRQRLERGGKLTYRIPVRLFDGSGSSFDLEDFNKMATELMEENRYDFLPTLSAVTADIEDLYIEVVIENAEEGKVIYVADDYLEEELVTDGEISLNEHGQILDGQKNAATYISGLFGVKGIKVTLKLSKPDTIKGGGLESSNGFNAALFYAMKELTGADLTDGDLFAIGLASANGPLSDLTGLQGWLTGLFGNSQIYFIGEVLGEDGEAVNPYGVIVRDLFNHPKTAEKISRHILMGQVKMSAEQQMERTATLTNALWTYLIKHDPQAMDMLKQMLREAHRYARAMREGTIAEFHNSLGNYAALRDQLTLRAINLAFDAHEGNPAPEYARELAEIIFIKSLNKKDAFARQFSGLRRMYAKGEALRTALREQSLYTWGLDADMRDYMREHDIVFFPWGAGGPGANGGFVALDVNELDQFEEKFRDRLANTMRPKIGNVTMQAAWVRHDGTVEALKPVDVKAEDIPYSYVSGDKAMAGDEELAAKLDKWRSERGVVVLKGGKSPVKEYDHEKDLLAVVDENGNVIEGTAFTKYQVHEKGLWHMTSFIMMHDESGRVLLAKRASRRAISAGKFQASMTEHVAFGETPKGAALRGTTEELGIELDTERIQSLTPDNDLRRSYQLEVGQNNEFTTIYAYRVTAEEIKQTVENYDNTENEEFWLVPFDVLERMLTEDTGLFSRSLNQIFTTRRDIYERIKEAAIDVAMTSAAVSTDSLRDPNNNKDFARVDPSKQAAALGDGVGDRTFARLASETAVNVALSTLDVNALRQVGSEDELKVYFESVLQVVHRAFRDIVEELKIPEEQYRELGTTLSLYHIHQNTKTGRPEVFWMNKGDSRIYVWKKRQKALVQLTLDDTTAQGIAIEGGFSAEWIKKSKFSSTLSDAVDLESQTTLIKNGEGDDQYKNQYGIYSVEADDIVFSVSDGVYENFSPQELREAVASLVDQGVDADRFAQALLERAASHFSDSKRGKRDSIWLSRDDLTVAVMKVHGRDAAMGTQDNQDISGVRELLRGQDEDFSEEQLAEIERAVRMIEESVIDGKPLVVEIAAGKGEAGLALAKRNPDTNVVSTDLFDRSLVDYQKVTKVWYEGKLAAQEARLDNFTLVKSPIELIKILPESSVDRLVMVAPLLDVVTDDLFDLIMGGKVDRILREGGELVIFPYDVHLPEYVLWNRRLQQESDGRYSLKRMRNTRVLRGDLFESGISQYPILPYTYRYLPSKKDGSDVSGVDHALGAESSQEIITGWEEAAVDRLQKDLESTRLVTAGPDGWEMRLDNDELFEQDEPLLSGAEEPMPVYRHKPTGLKIIQKPMNNSSMIERIMELRRQSKTLERGLVPTFLSSGKKYVYFELDLRDFGYEQMDEAEQNVNRHERMFRDGVNIHARFRLILTEMIKAGLEHGHPFGKNTMVNESGNVVLIDWKFLGESDPDMPYRGYEARVGNFYGANFSLQRFSKGVPVYVMELNGKSNIRFIRSSFRGQDLSGINLDNVVTRWSDFVDADLSEVSGFPDAVYEWSNNFLYNTIVSEGFKEVLLEFDPSVIFDPYLDGEDQQRTDSRGQLLYLATNDLGRMLFSDSAMGIDERNVSELAQKYLKNYQTIMRTYPQDESVIRLIDRAKIDPKLTIIDEVWFLERIEKSRRKLTPTRPVRSKIEQRFVEIALKKSSVIERESASAYATLEVEETASQDEIDQAYQRLRRKWHPDLNKSTKWATEGFQEIEKAYVLVNSPDKQDATDSAQMGDEAVARRSSLVARENREEDSTKFWENFVRQDNSMDEAKRTQLERAIRMLRESREGAVPLVFEIGAGERKSAFQIAGHNRKKVNVISSDLFDQSDFVRKDTAIEWYQNELPVQQVDLENFSVIKADFSIVEYLPEDSLDYLLVISPNINFQFIDWIISGTLAHVLKPGGKFVIFPWRDDDHIERANAELIAKSGGVHELTAVEGTEFLGVDIDSESRRSGASIKSFSYQWVNHQPVVPRQARDDEFTKGGIDLDVRKMEMIEEGDKIEFTLPAQWQHLKDVQGFKPVILNVIPVTSFPMLLGEVPAEGTNETFPQQARNQPLISKEREKLASLGK